MAKQFRFYNSSYLKGIVRLDGGTDLKLLFGRFLVEITQIIEDQSGAYHFSLAVDGYQRLGFGRREPASGLRYDTEWEGAATIFRAEPYEDVSLLEVIAEVDSESIVRVFAPEAGKSLDSSRHGVWAVAFAHERLPELSVPDGRVAVRAVVRLLNGRLAYVPETRTAEQMGWMPAFKDSDWAAENRGKGVSVETFDWKGFTLVRSVTFLGAPDAG